MGGNAVDDQERTARGGCSRMKYIPEILEGFGVLAIVAGAYIITPVLALMVAGTLLIVGAAILELKNGRRSQQ